MSNKVIIAKPGFNVLKEKSAQNLILSSDYGTLKYFDKQTLSVVLPAGDLGAKGSINHNLGYYPYVEVYAKNPTSSFYDYVPIDNNGASITYGASFAITTTTVDLYTYTSGALADLTFDFIIFIFKNDLLF